MSDKKVCKIDNARLVGYTNRTRAGSTQVFYTGNDERDFARYTAEGGGRKHGVEMHDKPDTIRVEPPEKHYYAQLIDGDWWWVNGCAECNGRARAPWKSYIECDKHNVCRTCKTPRSEITETPWGGSQGWQCKSCADDERAELRRQRLADVAANEYDESDYSWQDNVKCPHCGTVTEPDGERANGEEVCDVCGGKYSVEVEYSVTYSTAVIGERVTA